MYSDLTRLDAGRSAESQQSMVDIANLLKGAKAKVRQLTDSLPGVADPASISLNAKIPYKVVVYRETLIWRTEELARCACDLYQREDIVSAIVLTRAVTENAAAAWYLMKLIQDANDASNFRVLDEQIMRLLMGSKSSDEMPSALNVLTMLEKADKSIPGILSNYKSLSEYAHPNWSGTSLPYSKIDFDKGLTHLGKNVRLKEPMLGRGLNSLNGALGMFEIAYNRISDLMPAFISVCEAALHDNESHIVTDA